MKRNIQHRNTQQRRHAIMQLLQEQGESDGRCGRYLGLPDVRARHSEDGAGGGLHQPPADARRRRERRRSDRIGARRRHDPQSRAAAFRVRRNAL